MANDHFVAQTYLKHFGDSARGGMLHAYRKSDGKEFPCWPKDVCHEWDGDLNPALRDPQLLGQFRGIFEPHWNGSVESLLQQKLSPTDKWVIAGFMANLMICAPAWRRVGATLTQQQTQSHLSFAKRMKIKHGGQPGLDVESVEALERGELAIEPNSEWIKGLATVHLMSYVSVIYDLDWTILLNDSSEPFVTSDYPLSLSYTGSPHDPIRRVLPITPRAAVAIRFDPHPSPVLTRLSPEDLAARLSRPPAGTLSYGTCDAYQASGFNVIQARSAEDPVFSAAESEFTRKLVRAAARYRMDVRHVEFPDPSGAEDSIIVGSVLGVWEH